MFTIKHYGNSGYDVYEAVSYSVGAPAQSVGGKPEVHINYVEPWAKSDIDPQPIKTLVVGGESHAYITNSIGKTVDHIKSAMNIPTNNGYVTAL